MVTLLNREWYQTIARRRSRRLYEARPVAPATLEQLDRLCREFKPFPEARAVLVSAPEEEVFRGILRHYGKIKGAPAFIAFLGRRKVLTNTSVWGTWARA
jgi:nitroreductase